MRTLQTQLRLRRLLRSHSEYLERLRAEPADPELARTAAARLGQLIGDVRTAWLAESAGGGPEPLRRHVSRTLSALESAAAELRRPNTDLEWLGERFRESAAPLMFFLRGLEDAPEEQLNAWLAPQPLSRSA